MNNSELRALLAEALPRLKHSDDCKFWTYVRKEEGNCDCDHGHLLARITAALAEKEDGGDKVVCPCCKGSKKVDRVSFVDPTKTIKNSCHICRGKGYLINDASPAAGKEGVR